jgi:hypothetical protein
LFAALFRAEMILRHAPAEQFSGFGHPKPLFEALFHAKFIKIYQP